MCNSTSTIIYSCKLLIASLETRKLEVTSLGTMTGIESSMLVMAMSLIKYKPGLCNI